MYFHLKITFQKLKWKTIQIKYSLKQICLFWSLPLLPLFNKLSIYLTILVSWIQSTNPFSLVNHYPCLCLALEFFTFLYSSINFLWFFNFGSNENQNANEKRKFPHTHTTSTLCRRFKSWIQTKDGVYNINICSLYKLHQHSGTASTHTRSHNTAGMEMLQMKMRENCGGRERSVWERTGKPGRVSRDEWR